MNQQISIILKKRFLSFLWRFGVMFAVALVDFILENLGLFNLPPSGVVVTGVLLGEVTKFLRKNLSELKK